MGESEKTHLMRFFLRQRRNFPKAEVLKTAVCALNIRTGNTSYRFISGAVY